MSRAVILPTPGDPFLLNYWLKYFDKVWSDEIDTLYIYLNTPIEKEAYEFMRDLCNERKKVNLLYEPNQIDHGVCIDRTLDIVKEDYVMLLEDDCFILQKGNIEKCFKQLENGECDIVASKRGSCSTEILERAKELWNIDYSGYGDHGCNFWPNLFFTHKENLLNTDRNFSARKWLKGMEIKELGNFIAPVDLYGDTFVNTSLQLRHKGLTIRYIPQCHGHPDDINHYESKTYLFANNSVPWFHVGSLSSGICGILTDDKGRSLYRRLLDPERDSDTLPSYCNTEMERMEFERRVQWFETFYENVEEKQIDKYKLWDLHELYGLAIERVKVQYKLNRKRIMKRKRIYKEIGAI
jgi:hypothetical protein